MSELKKYLWLSQSLLFGLLLLCSLIMPSVVVKNGGVSNFGNHHSTVVPYVLGFVISIVFLSLAAGIIYNLHHLVWYTASLIVLALLEFLVLLSTFPRHLGQVYSDIHDDLGIVLFSYQFILSVWFVIRRHTLNTLSLLLLEAAGSIIGLLSITKVIHFLFIGQMLGALGFGLLLVTTLPSLIEAASPQY